MAKCMDGPKCAFAIGPIVCDTHVPIQSFVLAFQIAAFVGTKSGAACKAQHESMKYSRQGD